MSDELAELRKSIRFLTNQLGNGNQPRISGLSEAEIRELLSMTEESDGVYAALNGALRSEVGITETSDYDRKQADRRLMTMAKTFPFDPKTDIVGWFDELEFFVVTNGISYDGLYRKIITEMLDTVHRNDLRYYNQAHPRTAIRTYEGLRTWLIKKRMNPDALRTAWRSVASWKQREKKLPEAYERFNQRVALYVKQVRFAQMAGKTDEEINRPTETTIFLVFLNGLRSGRERERLHGLWAELRTPKRLLAHFGMLCDVLEKRLRPGCGIEPFEDTRTGRVALCEETGDRILALDTRTCTHCHKTGHSADNCFQLHPEKRASFLSRRRFRRRRREPLSDAECCPHCLKDPKFPRRIKHDEANCWTLHPKMLEAYRAKWKKLKAAAKTPQQRREVMAMMFADQQRYQAQNTSTKETVSSDEEENFVDFWIEAMSGDYSTAAGNEAPTTTLSEVNIVETPCNVTDGGNECGNEEIEEMEPENDDDDDPDTERYYVQCL